MIGQVDWGNVPDWVQAVGSTGAFGVVAYQLNLLRKQFKGETPHELAAKRVELGEVKVLVRSGKDDSIPRLVVSNDSGVSIENAILLAVLDWTARDRVPDAGDSQMWRWPVIPNGIKEKADFTMGRGNGSIEPARVFWRLEFVDELGRGWIVDTHQGLRTASDQ